MGIFDVLVAIILGIVEGITEWLPISSTGHMILVNQFLTFSNDDFTQMFLVVVQLGAIMAVVLLFWKKIFPFSFKKKPFVQNGKEIKIECCKKSKTDGDGIESHPVRSFAYRNGTI